MERKICPRNTEMCLREGWGVTCRGSFLSRSCTPYLNSRTRVSYDSVSSSYLHVWSYARVSLSSSSSSIPLPLSIILCHLLYSKHIYCLPSVFLPVILHFVLSSHINVLVQALLWSLSFFSSPRSVSFSFSCKSRVAPSAFHSFPFFDYSSWCWNLLLIFIPDEWGLLFHIHALILQILFARKVSFLLSKLKYGFFYVLMTRINGQLAFIGRHVLAGL